MARLSRQIPVILGVILALVPLLLFAYLGLHNRLVLDDYGHLALPREIGIWQAMLFWREAWQGDYSNYLLYGLLAPLGASAPPLFALLFCSSAFMGFGWLCNILLARLGIHRRRRAASVILASLTAAATINGFYDPQVFYFMSPALDYGWPAVMLLLGIALAITAAHKLRGKLQHVLTAVAAAIYAFVSAGLSEMYLVFQLIAVALIALFVLVFQHGPKRNSFVILAMAGLLGSLASLPVQLTTPGMAYRGLQWWRPGKASYPIRDLTLLVDGTLHGTLDYAGQQAGFAGFMLVAFAGLFVILTVAKPYAADSKSRSAPGVIAPVAFALIVQVLFIPILWTHSSDDSQVFGRFSYAFALVVFLNLVAVVVLLALLWRRDQLAKALARRNGLMMVCGCVLLLVCLLFALTQARNIHYKALSYMFVTTIALLTALAGLLAIDADEPRLKRLSQLAAFATAGAFLTLAALIAVNLWAVGFITERTLAPAVYALMLAGLLNGVALGALIVHGFQKTGAKAVWRRCLRLFCLAVALLIAAGMVMGHSRRISQVRQDAEIWDANHQEILRLRDAGNPAVYTKEFQSLHYRHIGDTPSRYWMIPLLTMQRMFYGLDLCHNTEECDCSKVDSYGKLLPAELRC